MRCDYLLIIVFVFISIIKGNAMVYTEDLNSLGFSFSFIRDNEEIVNSNDESEKINSDMLEFSLGYLLKGKYEFNFLYKDIKDLPNGYMLPFIGSYNLLKFDYHLKEREKFPLNFNFGISFGECFSNSFNSFSYKFAFYKMFKNQDYPITPYLFLENSTYEFILDTVKYEKIFMHNKIGGVISLPVKSDDNSSIHDIIWIDIHLNEIKQDLFLGLSIGLAHPISL